MRKPKINLQMLKDRRAKLAEKTQGGAVILASLPERIRNSDVEHFFRQESSVYYFTGFEEPESIFVFLPGQTPEYILFVREKDVLAETWTGFRYGVEGTKNEFGVDATYLISDFEKVMPELLKQANRVFYTLGNNEHLDESVLKVLKKVRANRGRSGLGLLPIFDAFDIVGEIRLFKTAPEVEALRKAGVITAKAHMEAMRFAKPGMTERQVQGAVTYMFMRENSGMMGYYPIVATGANATTLHYNFNDDTLKEGDFLLIDAGTEWEFHTADITRTFPVGGKFSAAQKKFYEHVLHVQKTLLQMVKPGLIYSELQKKAVEMLTDAMIDMKLLKVGREEAISSGVYKKYYPHNIGHWLGMDVHDVGPYFIEGKSRPLEAGMCFTIEPGLYIPENDMDAPEEYRGFGVRIEDNVLVTKSGFENLTEMVPKEVAEIERLMQEPSFLKV